MPAISVSAITELQRQRVARWHRQAVSEEGYEGFLALVCRQHCANFLLWHEEDIARDPKASDAEIAGVKRRIDVLNQQRNDRIEQLDDALIAQLSALGVSADSAARWNTETPGSAIDRLSILALRIYHMEEQAARADADDAHRGRAAARLTILRQQHHDLSQSLEELLAEIFAGRKQLKVYRQFKMYNDPTLNPRVYGEGVKG